MAVNIPSALKTADITRFATKAAQVEKVKPAVAYWCNYWIVQQIVTKGLHNANGDCKVYTSALMDKLEEAKTNYPHEDAITDDVAGQAYVEQFALDIFQRAENAIRSNKASRQTADTFSAAYTFLELLQIWPPLDPEITAKIKFAKYHAVRIAKAIKAGEDPNLSNPASDPIPGQEQALLDPNDPEVRALGDGLANQAQSPGFRQASVEEVPDENDRLQSSLARSSAFGESLHPSRAPSTHPAPYNNFAPPHSGLSQTPGAENFYQGAGNGDVSPLAPSSPEKAPSEGGGYFPQVPDRVGSDPTVLPQPPPNEPVSPTMPPPSNYSYSAPRQAPTGYLPQHPQGPEPQQPFVPPPAPYGLSGHPAAGYNAPPFPSHQPPSPAYPSHHQPTAPYMPPPPPQSSSRSYAATPGAQEVFVPDEEAISKAQKHARWAISALNFEDVNTAIKELRGALETLGAR